MKNKHFTEKEQKILESILLHRRDVRGNHFLKKDVSSLIIDKLLYAASQAPSVGFSQPWEFVVIRNPSTKCKIVNSFIDKKEKEEQLFKDEKREQYKNLKLDGILEAPINMAVFYRPSSHPILGQSTMKEVGKYSVVCAIQNMWLMSRALNIGMGWVSILDPEVVKKVLNSPEENQLIAYLCIGYVDEFLDRPELEIKKWEQRKSIESIVYQECYP